MLNEDIKNSINECVLCWLATADSDGFPNCSPKEIFTWYGENQLLIADVASPQSVKNIKANNKVCVSFVEIFKQKGFQLKGTAEYIFKKDEVFPELLTVIEKHTGGFPVKGIIQMTIESARPILAPSYLLVPGTTEQQQVESAKKTYGVRI